MSAKKNHMGPSTEASHGLDFVGLSAERITPSEFLPRRYGYEHEFIGLPLGAIIMMHQVRHDRNDQQTKLEESIEEVGMQSYPTIARLSPEAFIEYARVINFRLDHSGIGGQKEKSTQSSVPSIEQEESGDCPELDIEDLLMSHPMYGEYYYVLISGHSRLKAIIKNEELRSYVAQASGFDTDPMDACVNMIVVENPSPIEMMVRQITENIHSRPASEHIASDVLSLHRYLQLGDRPIPHDEFFELFGEKLPRAMFATIMDFGNLPIDVQKMAFKNSRFPFSTASKIGSLASPKRHLEEYKIAGTHTPTAEQRELVEVLVKEYLKQKYLEISGVINRSKRFGVNLQNQRLDNDRRALEDAIMNEGNSMFGTSLEDWDMSPEQLAHDEISRLRKASRAALHAMLDHPIKEAVDMVVTFEALIGVNDNESSRRSQLRLLRKVIDPVIEFTAVDEQGLAATSNDSYDDSWALPADQVYSDPPF
jgi:hypothetical protein